MIVDNAPRMSASRGLKKYVETDLISWMQKISSAINGRLNFDNNFASFLARDIVIEAGATAIIPNALRVIPNERVIVRQVGNGVITDGTWDSNALRLVNNGAVTVTISVRFFHNFRS